MFRVAAAFIIVTWLLIQLVDILVPMFGLPDWTGRLARTPEELDGIQFDLSL